MPEIKLCFFAHAGSSARGYINFKKLLDPSVKPVAIELAGRGSRLSEPRFTDAEKCAGDIFLQNREIFEEGNYAFFGHSLGTVTAYETAKIIKKCGLPSPEHIFFSGRPAPHSRFVSTISGISEQSDDDFVKAFSAYGGLPDTIVKNKEMLSMILPILRDDVTMADNYHPVIDKPEIDCDITVLYGRGDMIYSGEDIELWQECTTGSCSKLGFDGNHFYFNHPKNKEQLCDYINKTLLK
ncbi:MAG: thioesterase domain-containing protein [Oscillospiraceae bacterium]|nr:thioesterase domain-containing protein [Oscillospiraceae bacterium]